MQLQHFWELEDLPHKRQTAEAIRCENHFIHNTTKGSDGRYITHLPCRLEHGPLEESYSQAKQWLLHLERRLQGQPETRDVYIKFMIEYEMLGHMKEVQVGDTRQDQEVFYLTHHAVFKASSTATKKWVVFDGSAQTSNGLSLNDTLMVGPTIQQDLYSIVSDSAHAP